MQKLEEVCQHIIDELNYQCNSTSQNKFAENRSVSRSYLSDFISGKRDVSGLTIKKLFQLFPSCEINIHGFSTPSQDVDQISIELHQYIDRLTPAQKAKALSVLKMMFSDDDDKST